MYRRGLSYVNEKYMFLIVLIIGGVILFPQFGIYSPFLLPLIFLLFLFWRDRNLDKEGMNHKLGNSYLHHDKDKNTILIEPEVLKYQGKNYKYDEFDVNSGILENEIILLQSGKTIIKFKSSREKIVFMKNFQKMKMIFIKNREQTVFMENLKKMNTK
jgi:hypothetical protein